MTSRRFVAFVVFLTALACGSCTMPSGPAAEPKSELSGRLNELTVQSLVMKMADDYTTALAEAMRPIIMDPQAGPTARQLAQWYQRNGTASALDIAVGPNPDAALFDLLVLATLQHWALEAHWIDLGIPQQYGRPATERMKLAEASLWDSASVVLSDDQKQRLRGLIDSWIQSNGDRFAVSFVRFGEFVDIRKNQTLASRQVAAGLLREVSEASASVDSARLFGERALWYASRYPLFIGHEFETTMYRLADQPEVRQVIETLESTKQLSRALSARADSLDRDMLAQQDAFFTRFTAARLEAIEHAKKSLDEVMKSSIADLDARVAAASEKAVTQTFDRFAKERKDFLDDLESREGSLRTMMNDLRSTISTSSDLARELTGTVNAIDHVVARFDAQPGTDRKPLEMKDVRDAAIEATHAAEKLTVLLERVNDVAGSDVWNQRLAGLNEATSGAVKSAFWYGLVLVAALVAGQGLIRLVPQRTRVSGAPSSL